MNLISRGVRAFVLGTAAIVSVLSATMPCRAQDKKATQTAGVDITKMGDYRALAQVSYRAFQKGDSATAAELARILERTWDKGEADLSKSRPDLWKRIDAAMDHFINPIMEEKVRDPLKVTAAYNAFLEELKRGD